MLSDKEQALFDAIAQENMEQIEVLLREGVNVDVQDQNGNTPIGLVASKSNLEGIRILLKYNADFFGKYHNLANLKNHIPNVVKVFNKELQDLIFFEKSFQFNDYQDLNFTVNAYKSAVKNNELHLIRHHESKYKQIEDFVKLKTEALRVSYVKNDPIVLAKYIDKLCFLNKFLDDIPYFINNPVKKFLEKKIQESLVKESVIDESFEDFAKGYKLPIEETIAGLFRAIKENDTVTINYLLEGGKINLNEALFEAIKQDNKVYVKFLVEQNIDLEVTTGDFKETALHMASKKYFPEGIKLLLDKGANINAINFSQHTPLHLATKAGLEDIIQLLFEKGAKHLGGWDGKTPLHLAVDIERLDVAECLLKQNISPNVKDKEGRTPLHDSAEKNKHLMVKLLMKYGADLNAKIYPNVSWDKNKTPADMVHDNNKKLKEFLKIATAFHNKDISKIDGQIPIGEFLEWKTSVIKKADSKGEQKVFRTHLKELKAFKEFIEASNSAGHQWIIKMCISGTLNSFANVNLEEPEPVAISDIAVETHDGTVNLGGEDLTHDA